MEQTPQQPGPETKRMKGAFSRAGLSVAALYGTIAELQSVSIILMMLFISAWLMFRPLPSFSLRELIGNPWIVTEYLDNRIILPLLIIFLAFQAIAWGVGFVLMRLVLPKGKPIEKKNLSLGRFLLIALLCFGVWGVGAALGNLSSFFGAELESLFSVEVLGKNILPYLIYAVVCAPIFEELAFRKVLLDGLHEWHEGYAAVVSGLLFGLMHGNHMQFFLAFFIGLIFAMVYQRTGRVVYTMLLHGMINFTATLPELLTLWGVDISFGWNVVVGVLIVGGLVALLLMRKDPLLHAAPCTVPDANNAVYRNPGMRIVRAAGLALTGAQGVLLIGMGVFVDPAHRLGHLLGLIPLTLVFLTVLLLPKFTKRYEAKPETEESV